MNLSLLLSVLMLGGHAANETVQVPEPTESCPYIGDCRTFPPRDPCPWRSGDDANQREPCPAPHEPRSPPIPGPLDPGGSNLPKGPRGVSD